MLETNPRARCGDVCHFRKQTPPPPPSPKHVPVANVLALFLHKPKCLNFCLTPLSCRDSHIVYMLETNHGRALEMSAIYSDTQPASFRWERVYGPRVIDFDVDTVGEKLVVHSLGHEYGGEDTYEFYSIAELEQDYVRRFRVPHDVPRPDADNGPRWTCTDVRVCVCGWVCSWVRGCVCARMYVLRRRCAFCGGSAAVLGCAAYPCNCRRVVVTHFALSLPRFCSSTSPSLSHAHCTPRPPAHTLYQLLPPPLSQDFYTKGCLHFFHLRALTP